MYTNNYVPQILLAGDIEKFRAKIGENHPVKIIGTVSFFGQFNGVSYNLIENKTILLNDEIVNSSIIKEMAQNGTFDYIVFMDIALCVKCRIHLWQVQALIEGERIIFFEYFMTNVKKRFYCVSNLTLLFKFFNNEKFNSILDVDTFFADGHYYTKPSYLINKDIKIDNILTIGGGIKDKPLAIFDNVYDHTYNSLEECKFRHYDAVLLTMEREIQQLISIITYANSMTEHIILFVRKNSELLSELPKFIKGKITGLYAINGYWLNIYMPKSNSMGIYVVTHKKYNIPKLPENYFVIQAGKALNDDLGYIGDDTGDNISELNPYLNETTALYWIWKNTKHDIVGMAHYHRFLSNNEKVFQDRYEPNNILKSEEIYKILEKDDIILCNEYIDMACVSCGYEYHYRHHADWDHNLAILANYLTRNFVECYQPDYIEAFDYIISRTGIFQCNMFITRKYIFDAYCAWLFPIIFGVKDELIKILPLEKLQGSQKRMLGFICEIMPAVWLIKQHLKIKELPMMVGPYEIK